MRKVYLAIAQHGTDSEWIGVSTVVLGAILAKDSTAYESLVGLPVLAENPLMNRYLYKKCTFYAHNWDIKELTEL